MNYQDKKRYMDEIEKGKSHRQISKTGVWLVSASEVRDALIADGVIIKTKTVLDKKTGKNHVYFKLSGIEIPTVAEQEFWDDGTPKSRDNAFDWSREKGCLFTKQDIANARNQGRPVNYNPYPISVYARA